MAQKEKFTVNKVESSQESYLHADFLDFALLVMYLLLLGDHILRLLSDGLLEVSILLSESVEGGLD